MRAGRLLIHLTVYYLVIAAVLYVALRIWPDFRGYLPVGGVEQLITQPAKNPLQASDAIRAEHVGNLGESLFWLVVAIIGAFVAALPVSWVYMAVRSGEEYDQSLVNTIIVLPMVVTGIVIIVQNSWRWRSRWRVLRVRCGSGTPSRAQGTRLFILISVAIGLSAGHWRGRARSGHQHRAQLCLRGAVDHRIWRAEGHEALPRRL